jgi:hypothetical protein
MLYNEFMKRFLLIAGCLLFLQLGNAQEQVRYSGNYSVSFPELVQLIEKREQIRLFFPPGELDSLRISVTVSDFTRNQLLEYVLKHHGYVFSEDTDRSIYISKGRPVLVQFPAAGIPIVKNEPVIAPVEEQATVENRLFTIGEYDKNPTGTTVVLSGTVKAVSSGEGLAAAEILVDGKTTPVYTDTYGYFTLVLPRGRYQLRINSAGMEPTQRQVQLNRSGRLNIELQEAIKSLKAVIVTAEKTSVTRSIQVGANRLNIQTIKQVPVVFGETDVLKVVLSLPGVTSVGEASNGFNVRGGSADQNLILLGDATVFNPTHLFGFFSAFHSDLVKQVELYKASIPEKFGGRLSSVLDITLQDGNAKKWTGNAGIGPLTSSISVSGPIKKDKATVAIGARTSYSNWIMNQLPDKAFRQSRASFYDINLRTAFTLNKKNSLYLTGYLSQDAFRFNRDTSFQYGNRNLNVKWKHQFNALLSGTFTVGTDHYQYQVESDNNLVNAFRLNYSISQQFFRSDFNWLLNDKHQLNAGIQSTYYSIQPGRYDPIGSSSLVKAKQLQKEQALESAIYLGDQFQVNSNLSVSAGVRWNLFQHLGPGTEFQYQPGVPRDTTSIQDTVQFKRGETIQQWTAPEFRLSMRYLLSENSSVKASFTTTRQFLHMLSNTVTISPTDIWKLSDQHIRPQEGWQLSAGYYRSFANGKWEASVEFYYKRIAHYLDFKSGARLLLNEHLETDLINTRGKAWGAELLLKKPDGRLNGWFSYTYSRILLQQDDPLAGEQINKGKYYPGNADRPHNVNLIANYRFSHRLSLSWNLLFTSGRPITLPIGVFNQGGVTGLLYSGRNEYRIPNYFRSDISFTIEGNHKVNQRFHNAWSVGAYNVTARENPYSVYYVQEQGNINGYQLSIFGTIIPFVSYKIKF